MVSFGVAESVRHAARVIEQQYYVRSSVSALLDYLARTNSIESQSLLFEVGSAADRTCIDSVTVKSLDLIRSQNDAGSWSLMKCLDSTETKMGRRWLHSNILQPIKIVSELEQRHQIIKYFIRNPTVTLEVKNELKLFPDIDSVVSHVFTSHCPLIYCD
jgi:DNA mismatch repair protein MutS